MANQSDSRRALDGLCHVWRNEILHWGNARRALADSPTGLVPVEPITSVVDCIFRELLEALVAYSHEVVGATPCVVTSIRELSDAQQEDPRIGAA